MRRVSSSRTNWTLLAFLMLMFGYLVIGYPFMQLRIPPVGFGVPLGELLLIVILLTMDVPRVLARMGVVVFLPPFLIWWGLGLLRLALDGTERGFWAFRDSTQLTESLYLVAGFALAGSDIAVAKLLEWLRAIVVVSCLYGLLFVYADPITAWSPTLPGASDQAIPIFGTFATTATLLLLGAFMCVTRRSPNPRARLLFGLMGGFLITFTLLVIQARTTYLQLAALAGLLFLTRPKAIGRFGFALPVLAVLLLVISAFELRVAGRLTSQISVSFFLHHIESIFGVANGSGGIAEAAEGVTLRWGWWYRLFDQLTADATTFLTGLGYGIPLTDFRDSLGVVTREPHNSVLSVFGRLGAIGLVAWLWMQAELLLSGFKAYRRCRHLGWQEGADLCLVVLGFSLLILASCFGEDTMEKPYNAIPYYAFWGFALRIAYRLRTEPARRFNAESPTQADQVSDGSRT